MQTAKAKPHLLTAKQERTVNDISSQLPSNWVALFIERYEEVFQKTISRQHAYNILKGCRTDHDGWKIIESIAANHQKVLAKI